MQVQGSNYSPFFLNYNTNRDLEHMQVASQEDMPLVKFNREKGLLLIKGKSLSENATEFYDPLITIVDNYLCQEEKITCYFYFKAFNLSTTKSLFQLFKTLGEYHLLGSKITVHWFADWHNSEMIQTGIDYAEMYGIKVHILPI